MLKNDGDADKAFKKALFMAHPDFRSDPRLSQYAFWQEAYFAAVAEKSIGELDELREALLSGPGDGESVQALGELADHRVR